MTTIVYVHGGVSGRPKPRPSIGHAVDASRGAATALDAVELAVRSLEDDPKLNAGYGSVVTIDGRLELDAGLADGKSGRWAGVANVDVRHPISLARRILQDTPHVLVAGAGALALAGGMERLTETTPEQRERWMKARAEGLLDPAHYGTAERIDTVGAVALDAEGDLAAGSSTGGVFGKLPGRIGDAPIFGAGIYASSSAAVIGTGVGELFLETLAALRVGTLIEDGLEPQAACEQTIEWLGRRRPVEAGLVALDASRRVGAAFRGGSLAVEGPDGPLEVVRLD